MKKLLVLLGTLSIGTSCFAQPMPSAHALSSAQSISSAWKTTKSDHAERYKHDINMGYGGADISRKPTLIPHITTA